jgi:hypothetical protein
VIRPMSLLSLQRIPPPTSSWSRLSSAFVKKVGVHNCPPEYIVCDVTVVAAICPPLEPNEPHSMEHGGSIEGDMIACMSHAHSLFKVDNGAVFKLIKNAVHGTAIAASIAPFCCERNGRGVFMAIRAQYAGKDVWDKLYKEAKSFLQTLKWSGTANVTLAQHMGKHHQAYIRLTKCTEHILVDVPNEHSWVTYLMELINLVDPTILAALAVVCQDEQDKRIHFESACVYLVTICPVKAKLAKKGKVTFQAGISGAEASTASGLGGNAKKLGFGTPGIALCYHKHKDFMKLPKAQKDKLTMWQKANADKNNNGKHPATGKSNTKANEKFKGIVSALVTKQNEVLEAMAEAQQAGIAAMMTGSSLFVAQVAGANTAAPTQSKDVLLDHAQVAALKLQGILKVGKKTLGSRSPHHGEPLHDEDDAPISLVCASCARRKLGAQAWEHTMA